jgi:hypothetical protein
MNSLLLLAAFALAGNDARPPIHLWLEPEWFDGVKGHFAYWTGTAKATGAWGIAGPGISAEWSQGGESEWNSMGASADETSARCGRTLTIPRAGDYHVWVRYVDHRRKTEPFKIRLEQAGRTAFEYEFGVRDVVPANDEYQLFWGFSFGWDHATTTLAEGSAKLEVIIDRAGEAWRQVDVILITDDLKFVPVGREKPAFAYEKSFALEPKYGYKWRGSGKDLKPGPAAPRMKLAGRDFTMWTGIEPNPKWWGKQELDKLTQADVLFEFAAPTDIRDKFHKQFAGPKDTPLVNWPNLVPGFHLGPAPDLSPSSPVRQWLERTKTPFYIMTNYANPKYDDKTGPATYAAITGPLKDQFMGYIHGEAVGTVGIRLADQPLADSRREHVELVAKSLREQQAAEWSKFYKTPVAAERRDLSIPCLSVDSIALAHLFHHAGSKTVGYELDSTNAHVPMRIAFERGAARQFGGAWVNYASGNFGDACNYFTQNPVVPRGAPSWFHSKYAITDGVSISWYRKMYYQNYLGGASAIYWEQSLINQWLLPGPGKHPIGLSPFGRTTEDFQAFVDRLGDRGEPITPIGVLLSAGHGFERVNYRCKMLECFPETIHDRELRELFAAFWYPAYQLEGKPASPDVQSMPGGVYGDIFDVLVDRPERAAALTHYPIIWAAGDVDLSGAMLPHIEEYVRKGGTLVVNSTVAAKLPEQLTGMTISGSTLRCTEWVVDRPDSHLATPYLSAGTKTIQGAEGLLWCQSDQNKYFPLITRHKVGAGAVIVTLMPNSMGLDERLHPAIPYLLNGLTQKLLPIEVRLARRPPADGPGAVSGQSHQGRLPRDAHQSARHR